MGTFGPSEDERMSWRLRYGMLNFSFARHNEFAFRLVLRRGIALASRHLYETERLLQIYRRTRRINISIKRKPNKLLVSNEDLLSWKVGGFESDVRCLQPPARKYFQKVHFLVENLIGLMMLIKPSFHYLNAKVQIQHRPKCYPTLDVTQHRPRLSIVVNRLYSNHLALKLFIRYYEAWESLILIRCKWYVFISASTATACVKTRQDSLRYVNSSCSKPLARLFSANLPSQYLRFVRALRPRRSNELPHRFPQQVYREGYHWQIYRAGSSGLQQSWPLIKIRYSLLAHSHV